MPFKGALQSLQRIKDARQLSIPANLHFGVGCINLLACTAWV
jgi:hypothetical protein